MILTVSLSSEGNPSLSACLNFDLMSNLNGFLLCVSRASAFPNSRRIVVFAGEPGQAIIITTLKLVFGAVGAQECTLGFV